MNQGWVKLWRKSANSQVFQNDALWKLWTWCLMKANHEGRWVEITTGRGTTQVWVDPGQFIFGRRKAAKKLRATPSGTRARMEKLKNLQNLDIQSDTHYSIVTIRNWGKYQRGVEGKVTNKVTTNGQPSDHQHDTNKKKGKNVKNGKKDKGTSKIYLEPFLGEFKNVQLTKSEFDKLIDRFGKDVAGQWIENASIYFEQIGPKKTAAKYNSHYACVLNWERMERKRLATGGSPSAKKQREDAVLRNWHRRNVEGKP